MFPERLVFDSEWTEWDNPTSVSGPGTHSDSRSRGKVKWSLSWRDTSALDGRNPGSLVFGPQDFSSGSLRFSDLQPPTEGYIFGFSGSEAFGLVLSHASRVSHGPRVSSLDRLLWNFSASIIT
jgi:hypothetical protein